MPKKIWKFSISSKTGYKQAPKSIGIDLAYPDQVEEIARLLDVKATGWDRGEKSFRKIEVEEPEGSERLEKLLMIIRERFQYVPSQRRIIPISQRHNTFGVRKVRSYSVSEIENADLLCICLADAAIGEFGQRTESDVDEERFTVKGGSERSGVSIGFLSPFFAIAVSDEFKEKLECFSLKCVAFEKTDSPTIWKLSSSLVLQRSGTPLVDGLGNFVGADDWAGTWSDKYLDDGGYEPPEFQYPADVIKNYPEFDVAITSERIGGTKPAAFRRIVVSQRFRIALENLEAGGIRYNPVRVVQ